MTSTRATGPDVYCDMRGGEAAYSNLRGGVAVCGYCGSTDHKPVTVASITETLTEAARRQDTETLIGALALLPSMTTADAAERMTHQVICTILEERIPAAAARMVAWSELAWGVELSYAEALLAAIAEVTA